MKILNHLELEALKDLNAVPKEAKVRGNPTRLLAHVRMSALLAAQVTRAQQDVRYFLNGVHMNRKGHVVSTDGHRLLLVDKAAHFVGRDKRTIVLRRYDEKNLPAGLAAVCKRHNMPDWASLHLFSRTHTVEVSKPNGMRVEAAHGVLVAGDRWEYVNLVHGGKDIKFPDYQRVMPKHKNNGVPKGKVMDHYNAQYLGDIGKVGRELGRAENAKVTVEAQISQAEPGGSARVDMPYATDGRRARMVLMPMRV